MLSSGVSITYEDNDNDISNLEKVSIAVYFRLDLVSYQHLNEFLLIRRVNFASFFV